MSLRAGNLEWYLVKWRIRINITLIPVLNKLVWPHRVAVTINVICCFGHKKKLVTFEKSKIALRTYILNPVFLYALFGTQGRHSGI